MKAILKSQINMGGFVSFWIIYGSIIYLAWNLTDIAFLKYLQDFITVRFNEMPEGSYTTSLFKKGVNRMAQKVGEEAVETVIEATNGTEEGFIYEASDLIYHLIVLLTSKGYSLDDLARELKKRHK